MSAGKGSARRDSFKAFQNAPYWRRPRHKFNGGSFATICHGCSAIICRGATDDLYCANCMKEDK